MPELSHRARARVTAKCRAGPSSRSARISFTIRFFEREAAIMFPQINHVCPRHDIYQRKKVRATKQPAHTHIFEPRAANYAKAISRAWNVIDLDSRQNTFAHAHTRTRTRDAIGFDKSNAHERARALRELLLLWVYKYEAACARSQGIHGCTIFLVGVLAHFVMAHFAHAPARQHVYVYAHINTRIVYISASRHAVRYRGCVVHQRWLRAVLSYSHRFN